MWHITPAGLRKPIFLVFSLLVLAMLIGMGKLILDRIGLYPIPADVPASRTIADPRYADAIEAASAIIKEHRKVISSPAYSAAVAVDGKLVWAEAVGWADIKNQIPATPLTKFRIGSTSKSITVTATGRLIDKGIVDLDTPISRYKSGLPAQWRNLTLRQLHSHTAGLPGYEENRDWPGLWYSWRLQRHYDDVADTLTQFDRSALLYKPGEDFHYSSYDVNLASAILQWAAKTPFPEILQKEVFDPVGMTNTTLAYADRFISNRAVFYQRHGNRVKPWRHVDLSSKYASGGMLSTSSDLARLGAAYLNTSLLKPETVQTLWTPQRLANGKINPQSYALGWRSVRGDEKTFGEKVRYVHHGGVSKGSMSWLIIYPDFNLVIALNINSRADSFPEFVIPSRKIARLFLKARQP